MGERKGQVLVDERAIIMDYRTDAIVFVELASKKPEHALPADWPMAIWSEIVHYSQIYSASRGGAWSVSVFFFFFW